MSPISLKIRASSALLITASPLRDTLRGRGIARNSRGGAVAGSATRSTTEDREAQERPAPGGGSRPAATLGLGEQIGLVNLGEHLGEAGGSVAQALHEFALAASDGSMRFVIEPRPAVGARD